MKRPSRKRELSVVGFDSETLQGPPITFQFYSEHTPVINGVVFIGKRKAIDVFLSQLSKLPAGEYRVYGHNLEFDMLSALWEKRAEIRDGNIDLKIGLWTISGRYSKPIFAVFDDGTRYIELVDSILWFMTSLDSASKLVCPHLPKLVRPAGLGTTLYTPKDTDFCAYALRDAEAAFFLGVAIEKFHTELEVPPQISLASMAAAVCVICAPIYISRHYMNGWWALPRLITGALIVSARMRPPLGILTLALLILVALTLTQ